MMAKLTPGEKFSRAAQRMELCATELLYQAEHWTVTGMTLYDLSARRRELLAAARRYGASVNRLARSR
jgi:hypothetical protein